MRSAPVKMQAARRQAALVRGGGGRGSDPYGRQRARSPHAHPGIAPRWRRDSPPRDSSAPKRRWAGS